ncbi:probable ribonuclease ZC3H12C [Metopolophium dirhodum]|uniref:probable ribonuclease ZC3H12C n=1 Tax=Metopolophium dirhodum TaxID=44670 RepID=UPI0029900F42|nr:probable ribonuclease ZC3H12C [Metopolophium dirhodum]
MNINEPNASVVYVIEDNNDNPLSTDELKSIKTVSSKVTVPNITNDEIIDITGGDSSFENSPTINHKKTALNINNDEIIDITNITITSNTQEDVHKQFSSDTILFDDDDDNDDVQIIDVPTCVQNKSIELVTILDDSDEENTSNQEPVKKPNSFKSVHKRLGIPTTGTVKSSYNSPLRNRKRKLEEEYITKPNSLGDNLGGFIIDTQKMSSNSQNFIALSKKPVKKFKPQVSSTSTTSRTKRKLRPIIIDGLNIGFAHGSGTFSAKGIELCIQFFTDLGHTDVIVFIPQHRQGPPGSTSNIILNNLVKKGQVCFTPSRKVQNTRMTCHDDRIILNYAHKCDGVVVSNDNYRDLYDESEAFKEIIENRQVMVTFVRDEIIVPEDQYNQKTTIRTLSDILCFPE